MNTKDTKNCNFRGNSQCSDILESRGEFNSRKIFFVTFVTFVTFVFFVVISLASEWRS
jgi:hypothetical protein